MAGMRRISSRWTFFYKWVFPAFWFGIVAIFLAVGLYSALGGGRTPPGPFLIVPLFMLVAGFFFMRKLIFDLVDEVWDEGNVLLVRNGGREERIALADVMNVNYSPFVNPPRVTLSLRGTISAPRDVTFCAPVRFIPFSKSPVIDDLIRRVDLARRHA